MRKIDTDIWEDTQPLRFGAVEMGARMTVVKLAGGGLWVHSPIRPSDAVCAGLDELGPVAHIVAPNRFHHLFAGELAERYPAATVHLAPGLAAKRPDLPAAGILPDDAPEAWEADLDWAFFAGIPMANEVVFLHKLTRTLIVCDLAFHVGPEAPWATRVMFKLIGHFGDLGPTRFERLMVRDRAAARASLDAILEWDFDRVVVSHGTVFETGGRDALRRNFEWLQA